MLNFLYDIYRNMDYKQICEFIGFMFQRNKNINKNNAQSSVQLMCNVFLNLFITKRGCVHKILRV